MEHLPAFNPCGPQLADNHGWAWVEMGGTRRRGVIQVVSLGEGSRRRVDRTVDALGFFCPVPVYEVRKLLPKMDAGTVLELWADDPEVLHDIPMLIERTGDEILSVEENSGEYRILIARADSALSEVNE